MARPRKTLPTVESGSVVEPTLSFDNKDHVLKTLLEDDNAPILKSVGYSKVPSLAEHKNAFVAYTVTTQGTKVLKIEVDEPSTRYIAEDCAKIAFVNNFMSGEDK